MDDATLVSLWVLIWCAVGLISIRLVMRKIRGKAFVLGDYLSLCAILCALIRLALVHVIIIWGTNNMSREFRYSHHFTSEEIYRRETASKFTLVNRVFYNTYLWLQKFILLDTYRHLLRNLSWERITLGTYVFIFAATYVTVQIVTFTECDPFDHYWIVLPDPGLCSQAQLQLIVLGVLNIVTDLMLIVLPVPLLVKVKRPLLEKLQLAALFAVGFFIVVITVIRLPQNAQHSTAQVNRTTWASVELFAAAIVANAPVLYGFYRGEREASRSRTTEGTSRQQSSLGRGGTVSRDPELEMQPIPGGHLRQASMLGSKRRSRPMHGYTELDEGSSGRLVKETKDDET
ncbi:hypothetical protein F9C07_2231600 [Aspergillus flavus]|uniref:Rhodopsin domain-containing protein n=1 Tax=Aspergillus flavus (strain ATCC 200026 / FGSC A1120 / IAM 13836 / NRRL 3357 / JCM 12722 / SRRC 167) TaxID=332952 RepID=A0A7U2QXS7_ASPFN|nr:uncharacterized protein G4B84_005627 [Aspergillus flavus NRRL3357]KAJ1714383.1 hypothetical protein NYO67_3474 [Aspergillus flavus]QMW30292.1 hypothetical protein G4B84_005627 [Aspergillus flavus NRRL3357]QRD86770.1 hypothetical protein F9C07_2231600 [Aspergillus flavus]